MRMIDLFSGIGGISLAAKNVGIDTIAHVEYDKYCKKLLLEKFPDVPLFDDIKTFNASNFGAVDIVAGGSPCQDFSTNKKDRKGLKGNKSSLWYEMLRVIDESKPRWVVWENVANALRTNKGEDFNAIINGLYERGYMGAWRVFNSKFFGVPQSRRRVIIVASLNNDRCYNTLFNKGDSTILLNALSEKRQVASPPSETSVKASGGTLAHSEKADLFVLETNFIHTKNPKTDFVPTLMAQGDPHLVYNDGKIRFMLPVEMERLQGFPDEWTHGFSKVQRQKMLGNSVTVPLFTQIFNRIKENN